MNDVAAKTDPRRALVEAIFNAAADLPHDRRGPLLEERCVGDAGLRAEVEALLRQFDAGTISLLDPARSSAFDVPTEKPGDRIGHYVIVEALGEGGFGAVYLAEQTEPVKRRVALKVLKAGMDTRAVLARFGAERHTLARMDHPGVARVLDAGSTPLGRPFFVMELVRGRPLVAFCDERRMPVRQRLTLFVEICRAVQHAHQRGIIHRDLKPSNILVQDQNGRPEPKVIDFGIAKAVHADGPGLEASLATQQGQLIGTPEYMSPEQAGEGADIDTRTDVYSLGVILYELASGALPFDPASLRSSLAALQRLIRETDPPRPTARLAALDAEVAAACAAKRATDLRSLARAVRGDLEWIILKAIEKDRARRYQTVADLAADIERHLRDEPVLASPPSMVYRARKFVRRHRVGVVAGAAIALALVGGAVASSIGFVRASTQRDRAVVAEREALDRRGEAEAARDRALVAEQEAVQRGREAEVARDSARSEAAKAVAVTDFLQRMLSSVRPNQAKGKEVTVKAVLDQASRTVRDEFASKPDVLAELELTIGSTYRSIERYDDAEPHIRASVEGREALLGREDPALLNSRLEWAHWLVDKGRFEEAETQMRALVGAVENPAIGNEFRARCLAGLGRVLVQRSKHQDAEPVLRRVLALRRALPEPDQGDIAETLDALGRTLDALARDAEALTLFQESLEIRRAADGEDSMNYGTTLNNIGSVYHDMARYDDAEKMYRAAMAVHEKVLGRESSSYAQPLNNLAILMQDKGNLEGAEAFFRDSLEIRRAVFGQDHPMVTNAMSNLGGLLLTRRKFDEALPLLEETLERQRLRVGATHTQTIACMGNVGTCLHRMGRNEEAEGVLTEASSLAATALGPDHRLSGITLFNLGNSVWNLGQPMRAESILRQVCSMRARVNGEDHPDTRLARRSLATLLLRQGRMDEAEALLEQVFESMQRSTNASATERRTVAELMAELCEKRGAIAAAEAWKAQAAPPTAAASAQPGR